MTVVCDCSDSAASALALELNLLGIHVTRDVRENAHGPLDTRMFRPPKGLTAENSVTSTPRK